jgi:polyisoprenoid-binding protein YceI
MEVAVTPLLVYQNHRGRSIYQGRTTTPARIRNFIRTSRFVPQGEELNRRKNIPIWSQGRSRVWAPLKVAAVTGTQPQNYRNDTFIAEALENIKKGFGKFKVQKTAELGRADRGFYMDFYPWLAQDGTLFISLALFSQFDCKKPVFTAKITGPWQKRAELFRQAAALMEDKVAQITADPESGDSFDPVDNRVPQKKWEQIGFALPPAPVAKTAQPDVSAAVPLKWVLAAPGPDDPPMILFRFPAPLDNYAGEVKSGRGEVTLPEDRRVEGTRGFVEIDTRTAITMGDPRLDEAIQGSMMLYTKKFSAAAFKIEKVTGDGQPLAYGRLSPAAVEGTFELKGKRIPLTSVTEIEPILGEDGKPRLLIHGNFKIDLRTFEIEGADGPAPARDTLLFDLNFILQEK